MLKDLRVCSPNAYCDGVLDRPFTFLDLFSGLGGFHVAAAGLGGACVFASEWKQDLQELYQRNFGVKPHGDLRQVDLSNIPKHNLLCAGFPCQPFSKAGEQLGFECTNQGDLFFNVAEIIGARRPELLVLENVPNLLQHDGGKTYSRITEILNSHGYEIDARKFSPHQFGIPQIRERVYIVGSRLGLSRFHWPVPSNAATSIESVLDVDPVGAKRLSPKSTVCIEAWNAFLKAAPANLKLPSFPIWSMEFGADYPYEDETPFSILMTKGVRSLQRFAGSHGKSLRGLEAEKLWDSLPSHARSEQVRFPKWKVDFIRQNREFFAENRSWIEPWMSSIAGLPSSLQKFEWNVQGEARDIWNYVLQFRASGLRVKRRTTAPSLIAMTDTQVPIIGWEKRYMTPLECARLQSLEDLELPENHTRAYAALGNAVNSSVVRSIVKGLVGLLH